MSQIVLDDILTPSEVAEILKTSEKRVKELARRGEIPAKKLGRDWRFKASMLDDWFADWQPNNFDPNKRAREILEGLNGQKKGL